jgi:hypothetical protein
MPDRNKMLLTGFVVLLACGPVGADDPDGVWVLPGGFTAHVRAVPGGRVDWAGGTIMAEGLGKAASNTRQDRLMAKRAAEVVAARNALAVAMGLQVDADGRFQDIQGGKIRLRGVVTGKRTVSVEWRPNKMPPECVVTLSVPIWGVKGTASIVYAAQRRKASRRGQRLALPTTDGGISDEILVIDARGVGVVPCLFPAVIRTDRAVIYDVGMITHLPADARPAVRYVETDLTHEQLQTHRVGGRGDRWAVALRGGEVACGFGLASLPISGVPPMPTLMKVSAWQRGPAGRAASQPTSRPTSRPKWSRRRRVVKAVKTAGKDNTEIVLTREDADKLRNDPKGAALLRSGQVIVVVDSVAAGIQGRHDGLTDDTFLALLRRP